MRAITTIPRIPACTRDELQQVREIQAAVASCEQVGIPTTHVLHAGMYGRTCFIPAGAVIVGVRITVPTILIVSGHCKLNVGGRVSEINGYACVPGDPGRKQVIRAVSDTWVTAVMTTRAGSIREAEDEMTDEADSLMTRRTK